MDQQALQEHVREAAEAAEVPGIAVGVLTAGERHYACHGDTSVENPLAIDRHTLFQVGSTAKTFTATAVMCLVDSGLVRLDERVRAYVPELRLADESVAEAVTVAHLLNHTAGWDVDGEVVDTGDGDDAVAAYVASMDRLPQIAPLGSAPSYNNAALVLAGRVIEQVTGEAYDRAVERLVIRPLGMASTFHSLNDVMTRRFAVGHLQQAGGGVAVQRPWTGPRAAAPMGARWASCAADQLTWAEFHLGDGRAADGARVLSESTLRRMQRPTTEGRMLNYQVGIAWLLREIAGVQVIEHPGDGMGFHSAFTMAPERDFAISVLCNANPGGEEAKQTVVRWALEHYAGLVPPAPKLVELDDAELRRLAGTYGTSELVMTVTAEDRRLAIEVRMAPDAGAPPEPPVRFPIGMLDRERFVVVEGPYEGLEGHFVWEDDDVTAVMHVGRLAPRMVEHAR
ncbi:MAG: serine hydrolase domain-containing protein [bacterium]